MSLREALDDQAKKPNIIADCAKLVDAEVSDKGGLSGLALKAGYAAVKGIKPGFISEVLDKLLPEFADKLDPMWLEAKASGNATKYFETHKSRIADTMLQVTDAKSKNAKSSVVRGTYDKLRGSAKKNVEEALPRLVKILEKYA
jgi:hypothetical protein